MNIGKLTVSDTIIILVGLFGLIYIIYCLFIWICKPIKRDYILSKGRFLSLIILFCTFIPFVISAFLILFNPYCTRVKTGPEEMDSIFGAVLFQFFDPGLQGLFGCYHLPAFIAVLGMFFMNGFLISTITSWFDKRQEKWLNGDIRYLHGLFFKKYAIVIGANETAAVIIKKLLEGKGEAADLDYVILLTDCDVKAIRPSITSYLQEKDVPKLIIYRGQIDSIEEINKLRLKNATEIYVLGEGDEQGSSPSYHDIQNMKCVHNIASALTDKCVEEKKICHVLFEYQTTYSVFQFSGLPENIKAHLVFIPYNNYENWAQRVLVYGEYRESVNKVLPMQRNADLQPSSANNVLRSIINEVESGMSKQNEEDRIIKYTPLDGSGIGPSSKEFVHFIVVGMSKMGIAMAIQAAQIAHFPNYPYRLNETGKIDSTLKNKLRTRITFIDENADNEMHFFKGRYQNLFSLARSRYIDAATSDDSMNVQWHDPMDDIDNRFSHLKENFIDIEWEFIKGNTEHPGVMRYLEKAAYNASLKAEEIKSKLTIAICHPMANEAMAAALYMPGVIYDNAQQIWVYQREASEIVYNLYYSEGNKNKRYSKLRPFGMKEADFSTDKTNYYRAQLCNYAYKLIFDSNVRNDCISKKIERIGSVTDKAMMKDARTAWKELPIYYKFSNRYLANSFESKYRSCGIPFSDIGLHYQMAVDAMNLNKDPMAICEHNRWNMQQLLMGFRPYTNEEADQYDRLMRESKNAPSALQDLESFKAKMKNSPEKAHLNICPFEHLSEVEKDAQEYDEVLNKAIPAIAKVIEEGQKGEAKS